MAVGKRTSTSDPLTEHDVAERLDRAALRVLRIMYDIRVNMPELLGPVRSSRYWTNAINALAYELGRDEWNIEPRPLGPAAEDSEGPVTTHETVEDFMAHLDRLAIEED